MWKYNYTYTPEEEYLMHYGVKGMKWDLEKRKKKFTNDLRRQANSVRRKAKRATRKVRKAAGMTRDLGEAMVRGYVTGAKRSAKKFKSDFKKGYKQGRDAAMNRKKKTTSSKTNSKKRKKKGLSGLPVQAPFAMAKGIIKGQSKKRRKATSKNQKMRRPPKRT